MNRNQKNQALKEIKSLISSNYSEGCSKTQGAPGESLIHYTVKSQIVHWLKSNGYTVYTEATLKGYAGRPDIIAYHDCGMALIIEVLHTESEKRYHSKEQKYPELFYLIRVDTKSWNYDTFCI